MPRLCRGAGGAARVKQRGLLAQVRERGKVLEARLRERFGQHPHVGEIRGRGCWALELVEDRASKRPTMRSAGSRRLKLQALETADVLPDGRNAGWGIRRPCSSGPAYIVTEAQLDERWTSSRAPSSRSSER